MKKVLFIMSHLGSNSDILFNALSNNPKIDGFKTGLCYDSLDKIYSLTNNIHKNDNKSAIYMDELLFNTSFSCKSLCKYFKFIHLINEPEYSLNWIVKNYPEYTEKTAARYYCYRLRGIYEYKIRTPDSIFLTYEDLKSPNNIKEYLKLKEPIDIAHQNISYNKTISVSIIDECLSCYDRYVYAIKHLI